MSIGLGSADLVTAFSRGLELHLENLEAQKAAQQAGESPQFGAIREFLATQEPRLARLSRAELVAVVGAAFLFAIDLNNKVIGQSLFPGTS